MKRGIARLLSSANSVRQATGLLIISALASNILGLVRNTIIARNIPLGLQDNFWSAFLLPDFIFNVLIFGAISSAFIPLFRGLLVEKKEDDAWKLAGSFFGQLTALTAVLSIVLLVAMPWLIHTLFPRLAGTDATSVITLARWLLVQTLLFCWSYLVGGILNAKKRFTAYALSPLLYNISIIIGAIFAPRFGAQAIDALIISVIIGALLHLLIQIPSVIRVGFKLRYISLRGTSYTREALLLMAPRSISLGILSLNGLVMAAIARTLLAPGALSIYRLVEAFQTAPIAIFANAVAVALFPSLTEYAAKQDWPSYAQALEKAFRFILFTMIPATILFIMLRAQIIRLYIGLGQEIDWNETIRAIELFGWFAIGMVPAGLVSILARAFYAFKNTWLPLIAAAVSLVFGAATAFALAANTNLDVSVLGIAATGASLVQFMLLYIAYLRLAKKPLNEAPILNTGWRTTLIGLGMAAVTWLSLRAIDGLYTSIALPGLNTHYVIGLLLQAGFAVLMALIFFWLSARILLPEEWQWVKQYRRNRSK